MLRSELRIVSLIPSATELVAALGLTDYLVGRSHECDYPPSVTTLPICTQPTFDPQGNSAVIHDRVTLLLQKALSVYRVKTDVLEHLRPTHILTQAQCEVCAVSLAEVEQAVAGLTTIQPKILSLQPACFSDLWDDLRRVAAMLGVSADAVVAALQERVAACAQTTQDLAESDRPSVVCIEWMEPLMAAGNWVPEQVAIAGGRSCFGKVGQHSPWLEWADLQRADPDVMVVMPCGFGLDRIRQDMHLLTQRSGWSALRAVRHNQVYLVDGNHYFNRPGPRLVDSLEILAELIHPQRFSYGYGPQTWQRWEAIASLP
ncbi:cobalamin-binding protein [Leptolyngbya sp. CCY15150]|uniref:cobalamin-binding protein n=1 Tax=Leptolyngbya sp. CCY15150 TaxID=2767772 RepID=UPI00194FAD8A|nr:cobalamin-binding protein [Leptolyngbya sp. CCY15150]